MNSINEKLEKIIDLERKLNKKFIKYKIKGKIDVDDLGAILFEMIHCIIMSGKMSNKIEMESNVMEIYSKGISLT